MLPEVFGSVARRLPAHRAVTLFGWKRCQVQDQSYPAIIAAQAQTVPGVLWTDVAESEMNLLDAFEGSEYQRVTVNVIDSAGMHYCAQAYAWARPDGLIDEPWDFDWFRAEGIKSFSRLYLPRA